MSRLQRRKRRAAARGCFAVRRGAFWPSDVAPEAPNRWDVLVESELALGGPRDLRLSKRQAISLAYAVSVSKRPKLIFF